jgi:putative hemolysin
LENFALSYVSADDPLWKRALLRGIENASGRRRLLPVYREWSAKWAGTPRMMNELLPSIGSTLDIKAREWPPSISPDVPLVMVANHPFGIGDGIAMLALAEQLGRPYRVLINADFMRIPEIRPYALPIDFSNTREAVQTNIRSRGEARRILSEGATLVIFPAGGVATADRLFGKAEELPWKPFTARLIQDAEAAVLPVYFEGQNSVLFHAVSRFSLGLRLALMVSEFRRCVGRPINVHIGAPIPFEALAARSDRTALIEELYIRVQRLAPGAADLPANSLRPTPPGDRRVYPWDKAPPLRRGSGKLLEKRGHPMLFEVALILAASLVIGFA